MKPAVQRTAPWDCANTVVHGVVIAVSERRREAVALMRWLDKRSSLRRVRNCRRVAVAQLVTAAYRSTAQRAHYSGLQTCGSVWSCPMCAQKIAAGRQDELTALVEAAFAQGLEVWMVTTTVQHHIGQRLTDLMTAATRCGRLASQRRDVRELRAASGIVGIVKRREETHGANGWHPHAHEVVVAAPGGDVVAWAKARHAGYDAGLAKHYGLRSIAESGGLDIRKMNLEEAREEIGSYMGKLEKTETVRGAAAELTAGPWQKNARRRTSRTSWQLLRDAAAGDEDAAELWREYEQATRGRKQLVWTPGLRGLLGLESVELTDEELAEENDSDQEDVATITAADWPLIYNDAGALCGLLEVCETSAPGLRFEAMQAYLDARGIPVKLRRPVAL